MIVDSKIEYRERARERLRLWAYFQGTRKAAREAALGLLCSLRDDEGFKGARVFLNGRRVQAPKDGAE